jgi:putative heme iron utilization protein
MKNKPMQSRLGAEIMAFIESCKSLQLASLGADGAPFASYAPFAIGDNCLYVLLSELATHGVNLQRDSRASVLIIEDETTAVELFARIRVNYSVTAKLLEHGSGAWQLGLDRLVDRFGEFPGQLSQLGDFKLFRLEPCGGRYVKGFARAYNLAGISLAGEELQHVREPDVAPNRPISDGYIKPFDLI